MKCLCCDVEVEKVPSEGISGSGKWKCRVCKVQVAIYDDLCFYRDVNGRSKTIVGYLLVMSSEEL